MVMDMESRLKTIMAEGPRRIRGPFYNADDYPSLPVDYGHRTGRSTRCFDLCHFNKVC